MIGNNTKRKKKFFCSDYGCGVKLFFRVSNKITDLEHSQRPLFCEIKPFTQLNVFAKMETQVTLLKTNLSITFLRCAISIWNNQEFSWDFFVI